MLTWLGALSLLLMALGLLAMVLVAVGLAWQRVDQYRWRTGFDVRRDADLPQGQRPTLVHRIAIGATGLELPAIGKPFGAAFLEVQVHSQALGWLCDPWIELQGNHGRVRQYLERGAKGRRFINLGDLPASGLSAQNLTFRTGHLRLVGGEAVLHLFEPSALPMEGVRTVVVAPHPDDAELAAWGLISRGDAWVVTVTQGDAGPNAYATHFPDPTQSYRIRADVRVWDSLNIVRMAGVPVERIANLGYFDGTLPEMLRLEGAPVEAEFLREGDPRIRRVNPIAPGAAPAQATWPALVDDIADVLRAVRPHRIVLPHPQLDPHPDHRCCTLATLQALQQLPAAEGELWLYTNHLDNTKTHPVGPNDGIVALPHGLPAGTVFDTVVSLPMDERTRFLKRLAVGAQHDLQPAPTLAAPSIPQRVVMALRLLYRSTVVADIGFMRRAPRPNEIFYVVRYERSAELAACFNLSGSDANAD